MTALNKFKQHSVLYVNTLFTIFSILFPLSSGIKFCWFAIWILTPIFMPTDKSFQCVIYMSLYMRVQNSVKLFSIIICLSIFIILIKELLILNKNKLLNKYFRIFLFYLILLIFPLFYSILLNNLINISFIYYLNMINLLFLFYLLKNKLNKQIILTYCYGIIISCILSLICYYAGLHYYPFQYGIRFCAFMPLCNSLGIYCIVGISLIYVLFINKQINYKLAISLITPISIIGVLTFSKTFFITFTLTFLLIFILYLNSSKNKKKVLTTSSLILLVFSPFILYYGLVMFNRFFGDKSYSNIIDIITTGRLEKWLIYLNPWPKSLISILFGLGLSFDYNTVFSSHSLYVGYISKMGIIGLVSILTFIYFIVFNKNTSNHKLKYLPIMIMFLVCIVEDISYNTFNFIPFILAISISRQNFNI